MTIRPSQADRELISRMREEGLHVSPSQLVRWRRQGLLPRAVLERPSFGGSRVTPHSEVVFEACRALAGVSSRGRPWQLVATDLFEAGHTLATPTLRGAANYLLEAGLRSYRRAWRLAEVGVEPSEDPLEWVADVATAATRRMPRLDRQLVRKEVMANNQYLSAREMREAVQAALTWRIADINAPQYLTAQQRNLARHGSPEPPDVLDSDVLAIPSERAACIATLTWAEAHLARETFVAQDPPELAYVPILSLATWRVTAWRLIDDFSHPERPLTVGRLASWRDYYEEELDRLYEAGGTLPLEFPD